ncbi:hypothetical protein [Flavisolibacter nicotianae]|uniref:hypothetical protein n=1 Tax=Flavisolibacter nicotianae TaxID=2364882 RepID=UPI000EB08C5F|nr:hypothetical protein [Flavisolibacter nicotianae]
MTLDTAEYHQYISTHLGLLYFVGLREHIIPAKASFTAFLDYHSDRKFRCREAFYRNMGELLDTYIRENQERLTEADLQILNNFRRSIQGDFVILRCLSKHAVFMDTNSSSVYAVKALSDPFPVFFSTFPALCRTTLVPYANKIIYDGFLQPYDVLLGPGIKRSLEGDYREARANKAITTEIL